MSGWIESTVRRARTLPAIWRFNRRNALRADSLQRHLDEIQPRFEELRFASEAARKRFADEIRFDAMFDEASADHRVMRWACLLGSPSDVYQHYRFRIEPLTRDAELLIWRSPAWRRAFFNDAFRADWISTSVAREVAYQIAPEVERPRTMFFIDWFARRNLQPPSSLPPTAQSRFDREYQEFLERDLWLLFQTPGVGSFIHDSIIPLLVELADADPSTRERLLDETLAALTLEFSVYDTAWYLEMHRALGPGIDDVARRERAYLLALAAPAGNAVAFAQGQLTRLLDGGRLDVEALLDASASVFGRSDKKSIVAHLRLFGRLAETHPDSGAKVAAALLPFLDDDRIDLVERARVLLERFSPQSGRPATRDVPPAGSAPVVPPPRVRPLLRSAEPPRALVDDPDELAELFAALLETPLPATDLVLACESALRLVGRRPLAEKSLGARAYKIAVETYDDDVIDPRRYVARVVLSWLGLDGPAMHHSGVRSHQLLAPGESPTGGFVTSPRPYLYRWNEAVDFTQRPSADPSPDATGRTNYSVSRPSWSPAALFAFWLEEVAVTLDTGAAGRPVAAALELATRRGPSATPIWKRSKTRPSNRWTGWTIDETREATDLAWRDIAAPVASPQQISDAPFDLSDIAFEYSVRSERARSLRHNIAFLDWWRLLYGDALDHLAAQGHPELRTATEHTNVDTHPILDALADAHRPLGGPAYSALVLAAADKTARGRAAAAEAIAALSARGFFEPVAFAEQLRLCLDERLVMAHRVASTLADAAGISAIAGWRVLESLVAVLPAAASVTGGAQLVVLTARLATDYGMAVTVPDALARKSKGTGPTAVATRSLLSNTGFETQVALDAAEEARAALEA